MSITIHALLFAAAVHEYVGANRLPNLPALDAPVPPQVKPILIPLPKIDPDEQLGESNGTGNATDASPADETLQARKGEQNQAFLSRDPAGPGATHQPPSNNTTLTSTVNSNAKPAASAAGATPPKNPPAKNPPEETQNNQTQNHNSQTSDSSTPAQLFGIGDLTKTLDTSKPPAKSNTQIAKAEPFDSKPSPPQPPSPDQSRAQVQASPQQSPADDSPQSLSSQPPADPAPQAQTESDPFTTVGSVQFRAGGTRAQLGRPHRLTYPHIGMAGEVDAVQLGKVRLVLQLEIDSTGNVRRAQVTRSSGSDSIDQACRVSAYEWWFEPKKDKFGKPHASEKFSFAITFS